MNKKTYFKYGKKEVDFLKSKDVVLAEYMDEIGLIRREIIPDMFMALVSSIIGQQISAKAHKTVWERFETKFSPITSKHINSISTEDLQTCGISMRKAIYIKEIASQIEDGSLDLVQLQTMSDDDVCKRLSEIKGIGVWTAEMLMIFSMQRKDVLSWGDIAIHRGLRMLYGHKEITKKLFAKYKKLYSPYATVASLYLWHISADTSGQYVDRATKKIEK
jgi:DNA-3-methyladenine glycosylase II